MKYLCSIVCLLLFFSCKHKEDRTDSDIYTEKSIALINDALSDEYGYCDCLLEPPNRATLQNFADDVPDFDYEKYIIKSFTLKDKSDLNSLHGIDDSLFLKPNSFSSNVKIIYRKEWNELFSKYGYDARDTIYARYPNLCYFNKPIFDKNFSSAIVRIDNGDHLWFPPSKIRLIDGKWQFD